MSKPIRGFVRGSQLCDCFSSGNRFAQRSLAYDFWCAVRRHGFSVGANPARQLSLQPVAIGAAVEATKRLKPPV